MGAPSRHWVGCALASLLAACGGDDPAPPTCGMNELAVEGTVNGEPVSIRVASGGHIWVNLPDNGVYDYPYADVYAADTGDVLLHIEWDRTLARDRTTDAFGHVNLSSQESGSLQVGNCPDDGFVSDITAREDGADFVLRDLSAGPPCQGEPVDGVLAGCFRFD